MAEITEGITEGEVVILNPRSLPAEKMRGRQQSAAPAFPGGMMPGAPAGDPGAPASVPGAPGRGAGKGKGGKGPGGAGGPPPAMPQTGAP
jgi:hypothetical protein